MSLGSQSHRLYATLTPLSLAGLAVIFGVCTANRQKLLNDPDTQWHITTGQWIIDHGTWPTTDMLSHTFEAHPWIAKEWLSQILLASSFNLAGWSGVVLLTTCAFLTALWMVMSDASRRDGAVIGMVFGVIAFVALAGTLVARPHVLVFPILVLWTLALRGRAEQGAGPPWLALPLLVAWANMHAAFAVGIVIAAALGLEAVMRAPARSRVSTLASWFAFGVASLMACAITPYGIEPLTLVFKFAATNENMAHITEWQPYPLSIVKALPLAVTAATLVALLTHGSRQEWPRFLLLAVLTFAMLKHQRFAMFVAFVAPLIGGSQFAAMLRGIGKYFSIFQSFVLPVGQRTAVAAAALSAGCFVFILISPVRLPDKVAPFAALASVPAEVRRQPVYNSYAFGGFLTHNGVKTFIDGRSDQLFVSGFMTRVLKATTVGNPEALARLLETYNVEWAIIEANRQDADAFRKLPNWKLLHEDAIAQVYVRQL